jgi:tetratricopeptide (TPR) repeat protein
MAIPQFVVLGITMAMGWFLTDSMQGTALGGAVYFVYSVGSRSILLKFHNRGMRLLQAQEYGEAILEFESSYGFFSKHMWIDRYRSITMMSPSAISYREMALVNIAACYYQVGQPANAKEYYRRALDEFPNSMAREGLQYIESAEQDRQA